MVSFQDMMTRGMVFYDQEYLEECKEFCRLRNINYLPHIHSHNLCYFYDRDQSSFVKRKIADKQTVHINDYVYDTNLIDAFKEYEVLFVVEGGRIKGLVHYSDYNRAPIYQDVYHKLLMFERGLVHLILEYSGLRKGDLWKLTGKKSTNPPEAPLTMKDFRSKEMSLKSIMEFVRHYELLKIREADIHKIIAVRNKVAHSDNIVTQAATPPHQYSIGTFSQLVHGVSSLEVALRQLGNRMYFMKQTLSGDFSRTVIPIEDYLFK